VIAITITPLILFENFFFINYNINNNNNNNHNHNHNNEKQCGCEIFIYKKYVTIIKIIDAVIIKNIYINQYCLL
jgi:hypothetical protein